jgi:branched-chain amino acid transport system ATP-binding protein
MLEVNNINTFYGRIQALWDVTLKIDEAEIVAIIGANGAGKTTLLKAVSGFIRLASGSIVFLNEHIERKAPHEIVDMGISHIPEGGKAFTDMTVLENLEMGAYAYRAWKRRRVTLGEVYKIFPRLKEREKQLARTLSGGEKQMLAMGRGLMSRPKLCMFDEPSYGLAPKVVLEVFKVIQDLRDSGITILLIEQNVRHSLEISDRAYVLENGRVALEGISKDLLQSDYVRQAYLGR